VFAVTTGNNTTLDNGTYFYNAAHLSRGFAPTSTISLGKADAIDPPGVTCGGGNGNFRLSWHHLGDPVLGMPNTGDPFHLMFGYRAGCNDLNSSSEPRAVYQSDSPASLYFSGPAIAVLHDELLANGWSVCFSGLYNENGGDPESSCTGTYILLAGGGDAVAPVVSSSSSSSSSSAEVEAGPPGVPGIFLAVNDVLVGSQVTGAPIYCGADRIQPNSIYTLSIQSVTNSALTRIILDSGSVNSRGHLDERVLLPEVNPGSYKMVMTGIHASGNLLVLTNFITIGANGGIVSVSPESQQPFLK